MKCTKPEIATADTPRKVCRMCQVEKPETEFYRVANGYPWRQSTCKVCHNARSLAALNRRRARPITSP